MTEELKVIITAEINNLKKNVQDAKKAVDKFTEDSEKGASEMDEAFKNLGTSIKDNLTSAVKIGATAIASLGTALIGTAAATQEYRKNQAQLNAAFEQANLSASNAAGVYKELYGVIGDDDQAVESAANIAMLANSEKEAAKWAGLAAGIVGTFHDTLQPEAFYEAANETLKLGEATGAFTQMLEQTGVMSVDDFNSKLAECTTEAEKQALMLSVTEKAVGKAGKSYKENAKGIIEQNEAQAKLQKSLAKIGETMQPLLADLTTLASDVLAKVAPYISDFAEKYGPTLKEVLTTTTKLVKDIINFVSENTGVLTAAAVAIGIIVTAIGLYNAVAAVKAAMVAAEVTTVWGLVTAYTAQAAAMVIAIAPYVLIVAAIAAVIAIIVLCIKHWDDIKAKAIEVFEKIKETVQTAIDTVIGVFENIINWVKDNWQGLLLLILNPFAGAFKLVYDNCEGFRKFVDGFIDKVKDGFKKGFEAVKNFITTPIQKAKDTVTNVFNTIKEKMTKPVEEAKEAIRKVVETIKGFFDFEFKTPKIKKPQFAVKPEGWKIDDLLKGSIPKLTIKWNAQGGVFDRPTIVPYGNTLQGLGEAGAEAIVPLEKNTQWLDKIAEKLSSKQPNTPIVLNVDGKTFAQTSINTINDLTRQTGSLKLNIV